MPLRLFDVDPAKRGLSPGDLATIWAAILATGGTVYALVRWPAKTLGVATTRALGRAAFRDEFRRVTDFAERAASADANATAAWRAITDLRNELSPALRLLDALPRIEATVAALADEQRAQGQKLEDVAKEVYTVAGAVRQMNADAALHRRLEPS